MFSVIIIGIVRVLNPANRLLYSNECLLWLWVLRTGASNTARASLKSLVVKNNSSCSFTVEIYFRIETKHFTACDQWTYFTVYELCIKKVVVLVELLNVFEKKVLQIKCRDCIHLYQTSCNFFPFLFGWLINLIALYKKCSQWICNIILSFCSFNFKTLSGVIDDYWKATWKIKTIIDSKEALNKIKNIRKNKQLSIISPSEIVINC